MKAPAKIAVLGGGASGVVAASALAARGAEVDLYERAPQLGGLHRSVSVDGDAFDIGAFVFSPRHALVNCFPETITSFVPADAPHVSMTPYGTFDRYPFSARAYLRAHGFAHGARAAGSLLLAKFRDRRCDSVAKYARYQMGRVVYETSGLRHYIERLYGVPDSEIGVEFAMQRLGYIRQFIGEQVRFRWARLTGRGPDPATYRPRYLVRPRQGFPTLYAQIAELLARRGVRVHVNRAIRAIRRMPAGFELQGADFARHHDHIVSTVPVPVALRLVGDTLPSNVEHMGLLSLFYRGAFRPDAAVLYNFSHEARWKRVSVFSRYYGHARGEDFLTVEITGSKLTPERQRELAQEFEEHATRHELFGSRPVQVGAAVTEHAYPLFRPGHAQNVRAEFERLATFGIHTVGRQGSHQHLSSHDSIDQTLKLVRELPLN